MEKDLIFDDLESISHALTMAKSLQKALESLYIRKKNQQNDQEKNAKPTEPKPRSYVDDFVESEVSDNEYQPGEQNDFEELSTFQVRNGRLEMSGQSEVNSPDEFPSAPRSIGTSSFKSPQSVNESEGTNSTTLDAVFGDSQGIREYTKLREAESEDQKFKEATNSEDEKGERSEIEVGDKTALSQSPEVTDSRDQNTSVKEADEDEDDTTPRTTPIQVEWIGYSNIKDSYVDDFDFTKNMKAAAGLFGLPKSMTGEPEDAEVHVTYTDKRNTVKRHVFVQKPSEPQVYENPVQKSVEHKEPEAKIPEPKPIEREVKTPEVVVQTPIEVPQRKLISPSQSPIRPASSAQTASSSESPKILFEGAYTLLTVITRDDEKDLMRKDFNNGKIRIRASTKGVYIEVFHDTAKMTSTLIDNNFGWIINEFPGRIVWKIYHRAKEQIFVFAVEFAQATDKKIFASHVQDALGAILRPENIVCRFSEVCLLSIRTHVRPEHQYPGAKAELYSDDIGRFAYILLTIGPETSFKVPMNQKMNPYKHCTTVMFKSREGTGREFLFACIFKQEEPAKKMYEFIQLYQAESVSDENSE